MGSWFVIDYCTAPQIQPQMIPPEDDEFHGIDHFTVVCSVTWPLNSSETAGDLVLIHTSLPLCKSSCSDAN